MLSDHGEQDPFLLHEVGFEVEAELATWGERQSLDGWFSDSDARADATGAALWAVGSHWRLTHDGEVVEALLGPLAKGVHAIERRRTRRRREAGGLVPAGGSPRCWRTTARRSS